MATQTTTNPADVTNRLQTYFSRQLLPHLQNTLVLGSFQGAMVQEDIKRKMGALSLRFYRRRKADASQVQSLTEGVAISTFTEFATGYVDVTLAQIGEAGKISDILQDVDIFDWLQQNVQGLGEDAALKYDTVIRNVIITGLADIDNGFEQFCGVASTSDSSVDFGTLSGLTNAEGKATRLEFLRAATQLRDQLVPTINGGYLCAIPPAVTFDMRQDSNWLAAATQSRPEQLYKNQVLTMDGITFAEQTNPFRETVYGTYAAAGAIYSSFVFGRGAYGTPKLGGTSNPAKPKMIINNKADKSDPLNQYVTAGWKALYNAVLIKTDLSGDVPHCVNVRSRSTFNG